MIICSITAVPRPITVAVGSLSPETIDVALGRGCEAVQAMVHGGLIEGAHLTLKTESRVIGVSNRLEKVA